MTKNKFLKKDNFESKYVPEGTDMEELNDQQKENWKQVYAFAHTINKIGRKYTPEDTHNLCEQFRLDFKKVTKVFEKIEKENKDEFGIDKKPLIAKVEIFLNKRWDFLYNEVNQTNDFKEKDGSKYKKLNKSTLYRKLQHANLKYSYHDLRLLLKSDFVKTYNPFIDYFEKLPKWDKTKDKDYINELANFITTKDQEFFVTQFKKCLVRCIGCSLYDKENRIVFVFVQEKQETGKSTFIRFLSPFKDKYYTEAPLRDNKDSSFAISENFIYNLEELASASNMGVNKLKSVISAHMIKERKPYGEDAESQPRRCNFFASTNKGEFLTDVENTRWLCFDLKAIDWGYSKLDINKVWAQAFALYNDPKFNAQLTKEEKEYRDLKNKDYEINSIEKDLIKRNFKIPDQGDEKFFSNADILDVLSNGGQRKLNSVFIGRIMAQLGFVSKRKKINGHAIKGWLVKCITSEYLNDEEKDEVPF